MPTKDDVALIHHLMRRVGFGVTRREAEEIAEQDYDSVVDGLLNYEDKPEVDMDYLFRYHPNAERAPQNVHGQLQWLYRMTNTERPLQEKMVLFWHHVFATGFDKIESSYEMLNQIDMFRENALGNYQEMLVNVSKNPAMIFWLDNNENHKRAPNENWGRELLELFSMGATNYTEKDVFEASRAFTGWTMNTKVHWLLWGPHLWDFEFKPEDHDYTEKSFLGHTGKFNGEDVIRIVVQQPATHRFMARHLYNFFVADEPQVPAWPIEQARDPDAVDAIIAKFVDSNFEIKPVMEMILKSEFFKEAQYQKVKNPAEVFVGTLKLTRDLQGPDPRWLDTSYEAGFMGQDILNPPSVEGWHTGKEWINSGSLMKRVNFVADRIGDPSLSGVQEIVENIANSNGAAMTPKDLVNYCLDQLGPLQVEDKTYGELVEQAESSGPVSVNGNGDFSKRVSEVLTLIVGTREYQFG